MPDHDFSREQWERLDRWLFHHMANVGMGMEGEGRQETQRGFWWLNERRKEYDSPDAQKDRDYTRRMREASSKKNEGVRQVMVGVCSAVFGAAVLYILAKVGMK